MSDLTAEKENLLQEKVQSSESAPPPELPCKMAEERMQPAERDWDGHLLNMCGNCDHTGVSTFAYVKMLSPLAWGHNVHRAFGWSFWRHALLFTLLFSLWGLVLLHDSARISTLCLPRGGDLPRPKPLPMFEPEKLQHPQEQQQQFLAGTTYNPAFASEQLNSDEGLDWEKVNVLVGSENLQDSDASTLTENDQILQQVQDAKLQIDTKLAEIQLGRKMLHKHANNHDNEDDDDEDDNDDDHHKAKKEKKAKKAKKAKKDKKNAQKIEDKMFKDPKLSLEGPHHPEPLSPECVAAQQSYAVKMMLAIVTMALGLFYVVRVRTALRERFGIKGSKTKDCLAHSFCMPCAICQESRTLTANNVKEGVWYGPSVLSAPSAHPCMAPQPVAAPAKL